MSLTGSIDVFALPQVPLAAPTPAPARPSPQTDARLATLEWEAHTSAAILDLVAQVTQSKHLRGGCIALVNSVQSHLGCQRVAVAHRPADTGPCRLVAVSGMSELDARSDLARHLEAALNETMLRNTVTAWPAPSDAERHATLAHKQLVAAAGCDALLSAPLRTGEGVVVGAWILLGIPTLVETPEPRKFLAAASPAIAASLDVLARADVSLWRRFASAVARAWQKLRGRNLALALLGLMLLACVPWPYKVGCQCELQPVTRRFVAAPYAGVFEQSLVEPGDLVKRDQVLARMDGRELRYELAGVTADQDRAGKSRDVNLASGKVAASQIDAYERERFQNRRRLLESRFEHLDIKSPIDGLVISGDLKRSAGVPVTVGQALYEIAPLDRMVVEIAVPDEQIGLVAPGQDVAIRLDAWPGDSWRGELHKIQPRSETRDDENVFIAEVLLDNADQRLRPGMKGTARITTVWRPWAWIVFHRPWNWVVGRVQ